MTALLLDPHGDDAALFAAYTCLEQQCYVAVIEQTVPDHEVEASLRELNCQRVTGLTINPTVVYAPAYHELGHEGHNKTSVWASLNYANVVYYATYAPRGQRTRTDNEVPAEPWMIARKLRALSCFVSQIEQESTRPWFTSLLDLREWLSD